MNPSTPDNAFSASGQLPPPSHLMPGHTPLILFYFGYIRGG